MVKLGSIMVHKNWKKFVACCGASIFAVTATAHAQGSGSSYQDSHWFKWDKEGRLTDGIFIAGLRPIIIEFVVFDLKGKPGATIPLYISVTGINLKWRTPLILKGIPKEFKLNKGYRKENIWHVDITELDDLQLITPEEFEGKFKITLELHKDKVSKPKTHIINVAIDPSNIAKTKTSVTTAKKFSVQDITGLSGKAIPVKLHIPKRYQSKKMVLIFRDIPENVRFNTGIYRRGLWIFQQKDLKVGLKLTAPEKLNGKFPVEVFLYQNLRAKPLQSTISLTLK